MPQGRPIGTQPVNTPVAAAGGGGGATVVFKTTLSPVGTKAGSRQAQG